MPADPKRDLYMKKAVPEYWIVSTTDRTVERQRPNDTSAEKLAESLLWQPDLDAPPLLIDLPSYFDRLLGLASI